MLDLSWAQSLTQELPLTTKLCYAFPMKLRIVQGTRPALGALIILLGLLAQAPVVADETANLEQRQAALQAEISQTETSLRLLRANEGETQAVQTLNQQLELMRLQAMEIQAEQANQALAAAPPATAINTGPADQQELEVQRLKLLLARYYTDEEQARISGESGQQDERRDAEVAEDYPSDKVALEVSESLALITAFTDILESTTYINSTTRRDIDIIYHVEVRFEGKLVSSSSHSLKALGRSLYLSKVSLTSGKATVTIKSNQWQAELTPLVEDEQRDYLITLQTAFNRDPELHILPVEPLLSSGWTDRPAWIPYLGQPRGA